MCNENRKSDQKYTSNMLLKWLISTISSTHICLLLSDLVWSGLNRNERLKKRNEKKEQKYFDDFFSTSLFSFGVSDGDMHSVCTLQFIFSFRHTVRVRGCFGGTSESSPSGLDFVFFFFLTFFISKIIFSWVGWPSCDRISVPAAEYSFAAMDFSILHRKIFLYIMEFDMVVRSTLNQSAYLSISLRFQIFFVPPMLLICLFFRFVTFLLLLIFCLNVLILRRDVIVCIVYLLVAGIIFVKLLYV